MFEYSKMIILRKCAKLTKQRSWFTNYSKINHKISRMMFHRITSDNAAIVPPTQFLKVSM